MALLKCKMCGGSLEVAAGETIIECEYCGTQQTLPKTTDENIQALFNRANLLRQKNEFDKAEAVYEKILEADDTEAEDVQLTISEIENNCGGLTNGRKHSADKKHRERY